MADIRNVVGFSQSESLVKEYDGFRMYYPVRAKVSLAVTTKRLIVYSSVKDFFTTKQESLFQQINIDDIRGVGVVQSIRYRMNLVAMGIVILLAGILAAVIGLSGTKMILFAGIGCAVLGIIVALLGVLMPARLFRFEVWGNAAVLSLGEFNNVTPTIAAGPDLLKVVEELGALIIEIQDNIPVPGSE
ncbi:MAG: hypothetical protein WC342_03590 [Methanoregula sp.]|jgi:hypothetical protein